MYATIGVELKIKKSMDTNLYWERLLVDVERSPHVYIDYPRWDDEIESKISKFLEELRRKEEEEKQKKAEEDKKMAELEGVKATTDSDGKVEEAVVDDATSSDDGPIDKDAADSLRGENIPTSDAVTNEGVQATTAAADSGQAAADTGASAPKNDEV